MSLVEVRHESEDTSFFKSLRYSNVKTDLELLTKNGSLFIHRALLKAYSSVYKKITATTTKLELYYATLEDLKTLIDLCYEGQCVVNEDRLDLLCGLCEKMGLESLLTVLKRILAANEVGTSSKVCQQAETSDDEDSLILVDPDIDEDSYFDCADETIGGYPRMKPKRNQGSYIRWTEKEDQVFLESWLKTVQRKPSESNCLIAEALSKIGVIVTTNNICIRKHNFMKMYEQHRFGMEQPKIKNYIQQLEKIYNAGIHPNDSSDDTKSVESDCTRQVKDARSDTRYGERLTSHSSTIAVQNEDNATDESFFSIALENEDTSTRHKTSNFSAQSSTGKPSALVTKATTHDARSERISCDIGSEDSTTNYRSRLRLTDEIFIKTWLKKCLNTSINTKEELAKNGLLFSEGYISLKKTRFRKRYQNYLNGFEEPSVTPFLDLLKQIHRLETETSSKSRTSNRRQWTRRASPSDFHWTKEMTEVLLKVWLKHTRKGLHSVSSETVVNEVVDTLAQMKFKATAHQVACKKRQLSQKYYEYQRGEHRPGIIPYLPLLKRIHELDQ